MGIWGKPDFGYKDGIMERTVDKDTGERYHRHIGPEWYTKNSYDIIACDKCGKKIYAAQQYDTDVCVVICLDCYSQLPEGDYKG